LLGLEPRRDGVFVDPALPAGIEQLALYGLNGPAGKFDALGGDVPVDA